ncbi:MAG: hypothetical protein J5I93_26025 [Pirellulaceae bacterium]|nr:hypothetical protein [Pirellulaceae bacterium]
MTEQFIESRCADGQAGLRVRFSYLGDRFGHAIELLGVVGEEPVLVSREFGGAESHGTQATTPGNDEAETRPDGTEVWPTSPPLQQLSLETNGGGQRVALLLGMAGRSHWSLSVEPELVGSSRAGFTFDVACRPAGEPGFLGSRYQTTGPVHRLAPSKLAIGSQASDVLLEGLAVADFAAPQVELAAGGGVLVVPRHLQVPPPTVRWRYRVSWSGGDRS